MKRVRNFIRERVFQELGVQLYSVVNKIKVVFCLFVCLNGKGDFNYLCKIFVLVLVGENGIKEIVNGKGC